MTHLELFESFIKVCPMKHIDDWRPFGKNTIIIWLKGNRRFKAVKTQMVGENKFVVSPSSTDEWYEYLCSSEKGE